MKKLEYKEPMVPPGIEVAKLRVDEAQASYGRMLNEQCPEPPVKRDEVYRLRQWWNKKGRRIRVKVTEVSYRPHAFRVWHGWVIVVEVITAKGDRAKNRNRFVLREGDELYHETPE